MRWWSDCWKVPVAGLAGLWAGFACLWAAPAVAAEAGLVPATRGAEKRDDGVSGTGRRPVRPILTPDQYKAQAESLRKEYSHPPAEWPKPTLDAGIEHRELGLMPKPTYPKDNSHSKAKASLGEALFFEVRLSGSMQIACASCHEAELGWSDGRASSFGHQRQPLKRNSPSLMNSVYGTSFFWDGRAATLEDQALAVIQNPEEMHGVKDDVVKRLEEVATYSKKFEEAFGSEGITLERVAQALATYERGIVSEGSTPFDRFLKGERGQLSDEAIRGLHLFRTDARCLNCHNGPNFTDNQFHNLGLTYYGRELEDLGRYRVTRKPEDVGRFRTPSLRNVERTGPYMHNGLFDLAGVLNMYNAGMATVRRKPEQANDPLFPVKSPLLKPLGLNKQDLADLRAFLESLTERRRRVRPPETGTNAKGQRS